MMRNLIVCLAIAGSTTPSFAQGIPARNLESVSLEELMNIEVTSAGRREQRLERVPAAVYVLTQDEIRRSGLTSLPELFRLVPGMQVTQINSGAWGVSVRGFNEQVANKLLVLVDGRTIYNRAFSGVMWGAEDLVLEDIERIEVVRGPGAAAWGANAVNGVINIITKSAAETQGTLVRAGVGTFSGPQTAVRHGGTTGPVAYRVYSQWSDHPASRASSGALARDEWRAFSTGGRVDVRRDADAFLVEGNMVSATARPLGARLTGPTDFQPTAFETWNWLRGSVNGRWTHTRPSGDRLEMQSFFNYNRNRHTPTDTFTTDIEHIADLSATYHLVRYARHDVVAGGGYRYATDEFEERFSFTITPTRDEAQVLNVFAQDEIVLGRGVSVTVGARVEHDTMARWSAQPTARALWDVGQNGRHYLWAAFSIAPRTPTPVDRGIRVPFAAFPGPSGIPVVVGLVGNPNYESERFQNIEGGYRTRFGTQVSVDLTAFRGHYDGLPTLEPAAPIMASENGQPYLFVPSQFQNLMQVDTVGGELAVRWMPTDQVSVAGSYTGINVTAQVDPTSQDVTAGPTAEAAPAHQWQLRATTELGRRSELTGALYRVGEGSPLNAPAYTRADLRFEFKVTTRLSAILSGQNLLRRTHAESVGNANGNESTLVPRAGNASLVWRF